MNAVGISKSSTGEELVVHIVPFYPKDPDIKTSLQRIQINQFVHVVRKFVLDNTDLDRSTVKFLKVCILLYMLIFFFISILIYRISFFLLTTNTYYIPLTLY